MLIMDVPYVPMQDTHIVLAQAATPGTGTTPQPDFILKECKETVRTADPMSAFRGVDPAGMLRNYISNRDNHAIDLSSIKNITLLEGTAHGEIISRKGGKLGAERVYFMYDPVPEYEGTDRAVFMAEFEGKRYKIVVDLHVFIVLDENSPVCPPNATLIKVNKKPVSGSSGYDLNSISVTFADGAVSQSE